MLNSCGYNLDPSYARAETSDQRYGRFSASAFKWFLVDADVHTLWTLSLTPDMLPGMMDGIIAEPRKKNPEKLAQRILRHHPGTVQKWWKRKPLVTARKTSPGKPTPLPTPALDTPTPSSLAWVHGH